MTTDLQNVLKGLLDTAPESSNMHTWLARAEVFLADMRDKVTALRQDPEGIVAAMKQIEDLKGAQSALTDKYEFFASAIEAVVNKEIKIPKVDLSGLVSQIDFEEAIEALQDLGKPVEVKSDGKITPMKIAGKKVETVDEAMTQINKSLGDLASHIQGIRKIGNFLSVQDITKKKEKVSPIAGDYMVIVDQADGKLKKVDIDNLPGGGGGSGQSNTASNVGTAGVGVFKQKSGVDLEFKNINAGSNKVTIVDNTGDNEIAVDIDESYFDVDSMTAGSTNKFITTAEQTKLAGIESNATADPTGAEIKVAYEAEADTNAFTDADHTKLDGVATGATANTGALADKNTVDTTDIEDDAITADKLADTAVTAGSYTRATITVDAQGRITAASSNSAGAGGSGIAEIVEDTTPQLGGNLDMNGNNIEGVTPTEMGYVAGVTSDIQTQLDAKASSSHTHTVSEITDFDAEVATNTAVAANTAKAGNATHTGDVTGSTTLTIADDAVTYGKMQDVTATDKLLGRSTAGAGVVEEIDCTAAGRALLDDADAAAQRVTLGLVIDTDVQSYDANTAKTDVANEYTKTQNFNMTSLTDGASIAWDLEDNQVTGVTLAGNRALANPTNKVAGATYILIVTQDGTGSRALSYGSDYKFPGGTAPTLTTTASAIDVLTFICDGTNMLGVSQQNFS